MNDGPERRGAIFRQEALDEFAGRMRGDVLRLPAIRPYWFAALAGLWLSIFLMLVVALPWHESFLLEGKTTSGSSQRDLVAFLLPMHVAQPLISRPPVLMAGNQVIVVEAVTLNSTDADLWWHRLASTSARYKLVTLACKVNDADFARHKATSYRLKLSSSTLLDMILFKFLGSVSVPEIVDESSRHTTN